MEQAAAGDILVLAAEELIYRGDAFHLVVVARATGDVLDFASARSDYDNLSQSGSRIYVSPRWPRPGDPIFKVESDVATPTTM